MQTVLVVDDSITQRQLISNALEEIGLTVLIATDGIEALEQIESTQPDIVILDIVMPRMNGYEVCRTIKSNPRTQNVPVVICSSKSEEFDRYWGMKQGADAYLAKPVQPRDLLILVKQLLEG
ncbi:MAG: response regulator [Acaryochloridaceae cyanobacterium SU_2_1]|nr:response regulator [Acaryochloridaceae cyanobacterium SU_2_1]